MWINNENKYDLYAIILRVREKNNISYEYTIVQDSWINMAQYIEDFSPYSSRQLVSYNKFINKEWNWIVVFAWFNEITPNQSYSLSIKVIEMKWFKVVNTYYIMNEDIEKYSNVEGADVANFRSIYIPWLHVVVKSKKILWLKNSYSLYKIFEKEFIIDDDIDGEVVAVVEEFIEWIRADKKINYFIDANEKLRHYSGWRTLLIENNSEYIKFFWLENINSYDYIWKIEWTNLSYLKY